MGRVWVYCGGKFERTVQIANTADEYGFSNASVAPEAVDSGDRGC